MPIRDSSLYMQTLNITVREQHVYEMQSCEEYKGNVNGIPLGQRIKVTDNFNILKLFSWVPTRQGP
jgi:hypothetical protein